MEKLTSSEIRERFLQYFKKHQHTLVASSSLIPENDPTLLFANAGMNQFKNVFLGVEKRDYTRAVSSQKVVRAGGKHNDLENVGFTARHHTFFEMLGNFSFGDYFKKDAIHYAWDFLTNELKIPKERLYVTVFESDDEAADIWHRQEGLPKERIFRLGEKDNFWRMGDVGPCGPCTEIFYDHGPHAGLESDPFKGIKAGEDRFVEIWNLVFMQFYEKSPGVMDPLPKPSVDTGSGLERVTAALQGKLNNYDTDLFWPLIEKSAAISGQTALLDVIHKINKEGVHAKVSPHDKQMIAALRVVADHTRSCAFLIADGALPSNEGRGYVLRRILRRAVRFANLLSDGKAFMPEIAQVLIDHMGKAYPELKARKDVILSTIRDEQDRFLVTLGTGEALLQEELRKLEKAGTKQLPGELVFKLYDTYGFPADLTRLLAEERGFQVDEKKFDEVMEAARDRAKASWKGQGLAADEAHLLQWTQSLKEKSGASQFSGYESLQEKANALAMSDGNKAVSNLSTGQSGWLVAAKTPFYAEGGGQAGDQGELHWSGGKARVHNTIKHNEIFLHQIEVLQGALNKEAMLTLQVSVSERRNTANNHSATHLLHAALREVLGTHVSQAGSQVDGTRLRFDFTHNKPLTPEELQKIEGLINREIGAAVPVTAQVLPYKEAIQQGAMALFGEKYGDQVRVLKMGAFSTELCGGTHVSNTSQIRMCKIVSESGVSSGVRRIEAITGEGAWQYVMKHTQENMRARQAASINENWQSFLESSREVTQVLQDREQQIRSLEKEIKKLQGGQVDVDRLVQQAQTLPGSEGRLVFADVPLDDREVLATLTDQLKNKISSGVVVVVGQGTDSHPVIVSVSKNLNPKISAGNLLKEIAGVMGGKGGGRPDFAQGAVPDRSKMNDAKTKTSSLLGAK